MEYYAGKLPPFESRPVVPLARRVRFNDVTGFYEVLGGDEPPSAYPTMVAALTSLYRAVTPQGRRPS